ncbi:TPA: CD1107 family mobile element protein [Streptococcus pyogenes]|jgi:putative membrane protein|uniref:CD1107 family mobile element protein n=1 Tax=Streptococcus intermedius TaxID=1338 RepID=UPI000F68A445|nr:DUF4366 domain-containing protein [Streptococcus intermedius]VRN00013.1 membrane protein [Streptococcus pneumoniae]HES2285060.1 DUF4366 domain-containing protein [Streptococcus pyogenes]RSJ27908.1 hypothetical protein D8825_03825 [Streptococcus intermedius]HEX0142032.1 DUF4366 domain-containing protein [Streptococcus pneumoniae]HEX0143385.1 DUF4366 domain-containing protein [Streptococcus pneumoniae]
MKTKLKTNKKFKVTLLGILVVISMVIGTMIFNKQIVFAQGSFLPTLISPMEDIEKDEVEVVVKYVFKDDTLYKEEMIKAKIGQILDSGDMPMLPDDMKFIDEFLFYKVKGDGNDEIIRKVEKITVKDKQTQTQGDNGKEKPKIEENTQPEIPTTEDKGTQTELDKESISKMEKESKELKEKLDKLNEEIKGKNKLNDNHKDKIKNLEEEIEFLEKKLKKEKEKVDTSKVNEELKKSLEELEKKIKELQDKSNQINKQDNSKAITNSLPQVLPQNPTAFVKGNAPSVSLNSGDTVKKDTGISKLSTPDTSKNTESKGKEIRYPNKLTPKQATNNNSQNSTTDSGEKNVHTNKGVASAPSKARASVTENKDNANKDYPIHHNDNKDEKSTDKYSADARQFVTFQTKSGKTFHLIINHDEESENVMLLTEVSEDDLLNMVESKEKPKEEIKKIEDTEPKPEVKKEEPKKEKKGNGLYIFLGLIIVAVVGGGYYFKIYKKNQEDDEDEEEYDEFEDPYEREDDENEMPNEEEKQEIEDMAIDAYDDDDEK